MAAKAKLLTVGCGMLLPSVSVLLTFRDLSALNSLNIIMLTCKLSEDIACQEKVSFVLNRRRSSAVDSLCMLM